MMPPKVFGVGGWTGISLNKPLDRMEREEFDLNAVGRALITDPCWVEEIPTGDAAGLKGFELSSLNELV